MRIVGNKDASAIRVAIVISTNVVIIANYRRTRLAFSLAAGIHRGAFIAVIAQPVRGRVHAPRDGVADILGARILIVTIPWGPRQALAPGTGIVLRTFVPVITTCLVRGELTTRCRVAAIIRTAVGIIADQVAGVDARPQMTVVTGGAHVIVVTRNLVEGMNTSGHRVTTVVRAETGIVAIRQFGIHTLPGLTLVSLGARVAVVAGTVGRIVQAHTGITAGINRALVAIVAVHQGTGLALPRCTLVVCGAGVAVATGGLHVVMAAAGVGETRIGGAGIAVITIQQSGLDALTILTVVPDCAFVAVVTDLAVGCKLAPRNSIAAIVCAKIPVVARGGHAGLAGAILALVANRADIAIIARKAGMVGHHPALTRGGIAMGLETDGSRPIGRRTFHNRIRLHRALVGQGRSITEKSTVALIVIFKLLAIVVRPAVARDDHA